MATVPVPPIVGLSRDAAITALLQAGLVEGDETSVISMAPANTVTRTIPGVGTQVSQGSKINLDVSVGARRTRWWENTSSFIFSILGIVTLLALLAVLVVSVFTHNGPLEELGKFEIARGLITFLIAFTTVGIALILAISTVVLQDSPENDKRFDRGKQILTVLIGVLGTIVGFYFASNQGGGAGFAITSTKLPNGSVGTKYSDTQLTENGGTPPFKWIVSPLLPSGLLLSDVGVISGTPNEASQDRPFVFVVIDANAKSASKSLNLTVVSSASGQSPPPRSP
jgi:hypothetical protein